MNTDNGNSSHNPEQERRIQSMGNRQESGLGRAEKPKTRLNMELSLTIKLAGVGETLVAPPLVQKKGKIIQVRAKEDNVPEAICVLCNGSGKRGQDACNKCSGQGKFPAEYLLRINGHEGEEVMLEARKWATGRGLRITSKLILRESVNGDKATLVCGADGNKLMPSDKTGTVYTFRAFLVQIQERPEPDATVGKVDLIEVRDHASQLLPLFTFKTKGGDINPSDDVEILPDAIRTSKFFPEACVRAAIKGEKWSSAR
jgi:hypothetical protein